MANVELKILLNENAEDEIIGSVVNYSGTKATNANISNTSRKVLSNGDISDFSKKESGSNGLSWAYDYLVFNESGFVDNVENSGAYLESENSTNANIFWGVVPQSKKYSVKLVFENSASLKDIVVFGDSLTRQFPTRAILDDSLEVFSDDDKWSIEFPTSSDTHTIEFTNWNRGNYNATITGIKVQDKYIAINASSGLKSVESTYQTLSSPSDIFYGVTPSVGNSTLLDVNGELKDLVNDGIIANENVNVDVFANNSLVGSFKTTDTNYGVYNSNLSFNFGSKLSDWDYLKFDGYDLSETEKSAYDMLLFVFETLGKQPTEVDEMLKTQIVYGNDNSIGSVKEYLSKIKIKYPYLRPDTYRNTITKFCVLAQLQVVEKPNGEILFVSARPVAVPSESENCVVINASNQIGQVDRNLLPKNKIKSVKILEKSHSVDEMNLLSISAFSYKVAQNKVETISATSLGTDYKILETIGKNKNDRNVNLLEYSEYYKITADLNVLSNNVFYKSIDKIKVYYETQDESISYIYKSGLFSNGLTSTRDVQGRKRSVVSSDYWAGSPPKIENGVYSAFLKTFFAQKTDEDETGDYNTEFSGGARWVEIYPQIWDSASDTDTLVITSTGLNVSDSGVVFGDSSYDPYEIQGNELIQETATYNGIKMSEIIATNILNDYAEGISDATTTLSCADYYNQFGDLVKKWGDGDIINLQDVVVVKKDNIGTPLVTYKNGEEYKWRVKSVTFRKSGVPFVDLKLQEIRPIV